MWVFSDILCWTFCGPWRCIFLFSFGKFSCIHSVITLSPLLFFDLSSLTPTNWMLNFLSLYSMSLTFSIVLSISLSLSRPPCPSPNSSRQSHTISSSSSLNSHTLLLVLNPLGVPTPKPLSTQAPLCNILSSSGPACTSFLQVSACMPLLSEAFMSNPPPWPALPNPCLLSTLLVGLL